MTNKETHGLRFNTDLYSIKALVILDSAGKKILSRYYDPKLNEENKQRALESELCNIGQKVNEIITIVSEYLIISREINDVIVFMVSGLEENELMIGKALDDFCGALNMVMKQNVSRDKLLEKYDKLVLTLDQTIDNGVIFGSDANQIAYAVSLGKFEFDIFAPEQFVSQYIQRAQEHLSRSLI